MANPDAPAPAMTILVTTPIAATTYHPARIVHGPVEKFLNIFTKQTNDVAIGSAYYRVPRRADVRVTRMPVENTKVYPKVESTSKRGGTS
jgi:hypothetical protein